MVSQTVPAHQFTTANGSVVVHDDRLEVEIVFLGEDLRHFADSPDLPPEGSLDAWSAKASATMLEYLRDHLHVRTASGERLEIKSASTHITGLSQADRPDNPLRSVRVRQSLIYSLDSIPSFLSFEHLPGDELGGLRMRWFLDGSFVGVPGSSLLSLTSQGNFDVLIRDETVIQTDSSGAPSAHTVRSQQAPIECDSSASDCVRQLGEFARAKLWKLRFTTIYALIDVRDDGVLVSTSLPAGMVASFGTSFVDVEPNVLDERAQQRLLSQVTAIVGDKIHVNQRKGAPVGESTSCVLLPHAMVCGEQPPWSRISRNATRFSVQQWFSRSDKSKPVELNWGLFNGLVLTGKVFVLNDGVLSEHDVGSFKPTIEIPQKDDNTTAPFRRKSIISP